MMTFLAVPTAKADITGAGDASIVAVLLEMLSLDESREAKNWAQRLREFAENHSFQAQSLQSYANQLLTQENTLKTLRDGFRVASSFYSDAGILVELYDTVNEIINDVNRVNAQINYFKGYQVWQEGRGLNVVTPVISTARLVDEMVGEVNAIYGFVKNQIFRADNSLQWKDRLDLARTELAKLRQRHSFLRGLIAVLDQRIAELEAGESLAEREKEEDASGASSYTRAAATGVMLGSYGSPEAKLEISEAVALGKPVPIVNSRSAAQNPISDDDATTAKKYGVDDSSGKNATGAAIVNLAWYAITILAILFFGWNFFVVNHGDKQRLDALWKVAGGYVIMTVFLQLFKVCFF